MIQEVNELDSVNLSLREGRHYYPTPDPRCCQTESGFFINVILIPDELRTPFGRVMLFSFLSGSGAAFHSFSEEFIKRTKAVFEKCVDSTPPYEDPANYYEIAALDKQPGTYRRVEWDDIVEIDAQSLKGKKGSSNRIFPDFGYSVYKIHEVEGKALPTPKHFTNKKECRGYEVVMKIWEMLEKKRLCGNPITD